MSGNILAVVSVILFAHQLQGTASFATPPFPVDELESLKTNAVEGISQTNKKFSEDLGEMVGQSIYAYEWVVRNNSFSQQVKKTAEDSMATINLLAEELVERGKSEGKPEEYFTCVEEHKINSNRNIEEESLNFVKFKKPLQEQTSLVIESSVNCLEKLLAIIPGLYETYIIRINSCGDKTCVSDNLSEAEGIYTRADFVSNSTWKRSISAFLKYKAVIRKKATETEETISELTKIGQKNMLLC